MPLTLPTRVLPSSIREVEMESKISCDLKPSVDVAAGMVAWEMEVQVRVKEGCTMTQCTLRYQRENLSPHGQTSVHTQGIQQDSVFWRNHRMYGTGWEQNFMGKNEF